MDPRDELLADTQRKFAVFADRLTLEEARECQANIAGLLRLLIEWQSRVEDQTPSPIQTQQTPTIPHCPPHSQRKRSRASARVH
jgi:hypothetical protein